MVRWEAMEQWLFEKVDEHGPGFTFNRAELEQDVGSSYEAGASIQAYLDAQRHPKSTTLYVLKRRGRTRTAVWSVGERTADARALGDTLHKDIVTKVRRAYAPDMKRLAMVNPRAAKYVNKKIDRVVRNVLPLIADAVDGYFEGYEE